MTKPWSPGKRHFEPYLAGVDARTIADRLGHSSPAFTMKTYVHGVPRGILRERVKAGMDRAKKQGKHVGRPRVVNGEWATVRPLIESGAMSQRKAAQALGVGRSTVSRLMSPNGGIRSDQ